MLSVLNKLKGDKRNLQNAPAPAPMSTALQKKFSKGINYNMKILIRGDRNVGKSCLLQRLQGGPFIDEYRPTDQIQIAPIHWTYKNTDHIVKVDVWEVVDKGRAKKKLNAGLKLDNSPGGEAEDDTPALDATFLDVYKNANGVIMMMDITKPWTFDYVVRELSSVPPELPVIVLGNHCDMHHHRQIHPHQIEQIITNAKETRSGDIRYAEASMRNGFGLRLLHRFFNVPFLLLQRATLMTQITLNRQETEIACEELDHYQNSEEADYLIFLEKLASKRRQDTAAPPLHDMSKSPSIVLGGGKPIVPPTPVNPLANTTSAQVSPNKPFLEKVDSGAPKLQPSNTLTVPTVSVSKTANDLEDFCAGDLDNSFLDEPSNSNNNGMSSAFTKKMSLESDSDNEAGGNPLVAGIQDDLDSADEDNASKCVSIKETSKFYAKPASKPIEAQRVEVKLPVYGLRTPEDDSEPELKAQAVEDYEPTAMWTTDSCVRRSPEGGEDVSVNSVENKEKKQKKSKKSKDKDKSTSDKEKKKDKDKKHKEKKHKRKTSDEYLEEFLNGTSSAPGAQTSYEDI